MICPERMKQCRLGCETENVCLESMGYVSDSQPEPTNQAPEAPSPEQLAEADVDNNIRREIRVFNAGDGWMWAYYNDPLPPYSPMNKFADKKAAMRSARRFVESVSKSTIFYLHGEGVDAYWERA